MSDYDIHHVLPTRLFQWKFEKNIAYSILEEIHNKKDLIETISSATTLQPKEKFVSNRDYHIELITVEQVLQKIVSDLQEDGYDVSLNMYFVAGYRGFSANTIHNHKTVFSDPTNYSGIIYLSDIGETKFFSCSPHSWETGFTIPSEIGKVVLFPSTIPHEITNDFDVTNERYVVPFNLILNKF